MVTDRDTIGGPPGRPPENNHDEKDKSSEERPSSLVVVASALTAMTATALVSVFGVAGTIVGAGISSVITVMANFIYRDSLRRTADKVGSVAKRPSQRSGRTRASEPRRSDTKLTGEGSTEDRNAADADTNARNAAEEDTQTLRTPGDDTHVAATARPDDTEPGQEDDWRSRLRSHWRAVVDRVGWPKIVGAIVAVFVLILAVVTVVELSAGRPLTDIVRDQEGSGTTVFGSTSDTDEEPVEEEPGQDPGPGEDDPAQEPGEEPPAEEPPAEEPPADEPVDPAPPLEDQPAVNE